ncbi:Cysteine/Histidine-rich C1 domain family protein [Raphanus sativus]|nr:Cysteine/Histidine-rich C1 domain family protein [Raphanus sativus]
MYKVSFHDHPLFPSAKFVTTFCGACSAYETIYCGYYCKDPDCIGLFFHKKCIETPLEINHPSHPQHHPLLLTNHNFGDDPCDLLTHHLGAGYSKCGVCRKSLSQYHGAYSCSVCPEYAVHCRCAVSYDIWDGVELEVTKNIL